MKYENIMEHCTNVEKINFREFDGKSIDKKVSISGSDVFSINQTEKVASFRICFCALPADGGLLNRGLSHDKLPELKHLKNVLLMLFAPQKIH